MYKKKLLVGLLVFSTIKFVDTLDPFQDCDFSLSPNSISSKVSDEDLINKLNFSANFILCKLLVGESCKTEIADRYLEFVLEEDYSKYLDNFLDLYFFYFLHCLRHWNVIQMMCQGSKDNILNSWKNLSFTEKTSFFYLQQKSSNTYFIQELSALENFEEINNLFFIDKFDDDFKVSEKVKLLVQQINVLTNIYRNSNSLDKN